MKKIICRKCLDVKSTDEFTKQGYFFKWKCKDCESKPKIEEYRVCECCGDKKLIIKFKFIEQKYYSKKCKICSRASGRKKYLTDKENNYHSILFSSYKKEDRKKNREFNLTKEFIKDTISKGCQYCEATKQVGLDRIDNTIGHIVNNVIPCCRRCNVIRGTMPYETWLHFVPTLKFINKNNLFGDWQPASYKSKDNFKVNE
jgi:hypothetical protein